MKELDSVGYGRFMMLSTAIENAKLKNLVKERSSITLASPFKHHTQSREFSDSSIEEYSLKNRPVAIPDSRPSQFKKDSSSEEEVKAP